MHVSARAAGEKQTKPKQKLTQKKKDTVATPVAEIGTDLGPQPQELIFSSSKATISKRISSSICATACEAGIPRRWVQMRRPITTAWIWTILHVRELYPYYCIPCGLRNLTQLLHNWYTRLSCHDKYGKAIVVCINEPLTAQCSS